MDGGEVERSSRIFFRSSVFVLGIFFKVAVSPETVEAFESALAQRTEARVVDMDDHLDDVSKDWRNPGIASA